MMERFNTEVAKKNEVPEPINYLAYSNQSNVLKNDKSINLLGEGEPRAERSST